MKSVEVLGDTAILHFLETEASLDDPEGMLHVRNHTRLTSIGFTISIGERSISVSALVGKVARMLGMMANDVALPSIRRATIHATLLAVKQSAQHHAVVHVCSGRCYAVDRSRSTIQADVRFHPEVPLIALLGLMHLGLAFALRVLRRARSADDRRIDDYSGADLDAALPKMSVHCSEDPFSEFVLLEQMSKLAYSRFIGSALTTQVDANKAPHRDAVVQRFLDRRIAQIEPLLQSRSSTRVSWPSPTRPLACGPSVADQRCGYDSLGSREPVSRRAKCTTSTTFRS